ncbi:hypothetical protein ACHAWT_010932 [Skeletonema menzelii]
MFDSDCVFIPSEVLHSKNASSDLSSPITKLIVCHKSQKSFERSTRRASRSIKQIWSSYVDAKNDSTVSDVYLLCGSNTNVKDRLTKEFESTAACIPVEISKNKVVNVAKINADSRGDGLNVMFVDLDSLSTQEHATSVSEIQSLMDEIVTLVKDKHTLMHVKSDVISHSIASIHSDNNRDNSKHIDGQELKSFLTVQEQAIIKSHLTGDLIRRLNKKNVAKNCPLTNHAARFIQSSINAGERKEICRFYNYDVERGCLRSMKAQRNKKLKGCDMDHEHCHRCGCQGHRAFECTNDATTDANKSLLFQESEDGEITLVSLDGDEFKPTEPRDIPVPSLLVLGGRCRGRTLNSCEFLPLSPSDRSWRALPNLQEHRGSHAACSPKGSGIVFVMGGGGVDGNLDTVELLDLKKSHQNSPSDGTEFKWSIMSDRLSSARHAFGAVSVTKDNTHTSYAVGGWMYGTKSCESMEKLSFKSSQHCRELELQRIARWEKCNPILTPRRLHSVAANVDGSSIFVFGGYIDERQVTSSIESYNIETDCWSATDKLPYPEKSCPLVQAVPDWSPGAKSSFLIFPYSENNTNETMPEVLRYTPNSLEKFEPVVVPNVDKTSSVEHLQMPIKNWHSFSATVSQSLQSAYVVGGLIDSKWTGRGFSLDLNTMKWQELPEMSLPRRRLTSLVIE